MTSKGGRPRKPDITEEEFRIATEMLEGKVAGVRGSWRGAADGLTAVRIQGAKTPQDRKRLQITHMLFREMRARGWCSKTHEGLLQEQKAAAKAAQTRSSPGRPETEEGTLPGTPGGPG